MKAQTKGKAISTVSVATKLRSIERELAALESLKDELRVFLLDNLKKQGVRSIKLDDGTMYVRSERSTLKVVPTKQNEAWAWASEHHALKIDTAKAQQILRHELKCPRFFKAERTEYLTIKRVNEQ